eukprot:gnl/TRDRNA2_/TRDRNA2_127537_c0_seq1.p1 gnl/TRDRNA2_/TRDRNA2_127537_c0~~gnl/TRDRNA2_/TRDRNA2_127537_c0_seq1.p1  ORF type:complete len:393 (-),score=97.98 gnl/TRDRNA2_/TRDRNA2_127537_c0_seq1:129-1307(-)
MFSNAPLLHSCGRRRIEDGVGHVKEHLKVAQERLKVAEDRAEQLSKDILVVTERCRHYEQQTQELEGLSAQANSEASSAKKQVSILEESMKAKVCALEACLELKEKKHQDEVLSYGNQIAALEMLVQHRDEEIVELQRSLSTNETQTRAANEDVTKKHQDEISSQKSRVAALQASLRLQEKHANELSEMLKAKESLIQAAERALQAKETVVAAAEQNAKDAMERNRQLESAAARDKDIIKKREDELSAFKVQLALLERSAQEREERCSILTRPYLAELRTELEAKFANVDASEVEARDSTSGARSMPIQRLGLSQRPASPTRSVSPVGTRSMPASLMMPPASAPCLSREPRLPPQPMTPQHMPIHLPGHIPRAQRDLRRIPLRMPSPPSPRT